MAAVAAAAGGQLFSIKWWLHGSQGPVTMRTPCTNDDPPHLNIGNHHDIKYREEAYVNYAVKYLSCSKHSCCLSHRPMQELPSS